MAVQEIGTTVQGTSFFVFDLSWPWPPLTPFKSRTELKEGFLLISVGEIGRIIASMFSVVDDKVNLMCSLSTGRLRLRGKSRILVGVVWLDSQITSVQINGELRASITSPSISNHHFRVKPGIEYSQNPIDYSVQNAKMIRNRRGLYNGLRPKDGTNFGGEKYLFSSLLDEANQIDDLLQLIMSGSTYHTRGLAARLRVLLSRRSQYPLLLTAAGAKDLPLVIYTFAHPELLPPVQPSLSLMLSRANSLPTDPALQNPVDIDVWLKFPAMQINDQVITNEMVISDLGNTIGSHLEINLVPSVVALNSFSFGFGDIPFNALVAYVSSVGQVVLTLSRQVLQASEAQ